MPDVTPNYGWPYPLPGDSLATIDERVRELALGVDEDLSALGGDVADLHSFAHTGTGNRLDATSTAQPSQPAGLRIVTGRVATSTDSGGVVLVTFPGGGFAGGVLYVAATSLSGTGVAPVVNAGSVSKTTATFVWPGVNSTAITFAYLAIGF